MKTHMRARSFSYSAYCGQKLKDTLPDTTSAWAKVTCKRCQAIRAERARGTNA